MFKKRSWVLAASALLILSPALRAMDSEGPNPRSRWFKPLMIIGGGVGISAAAFYLLSPERTMDPETRIMYRFLGNMQNNAETKQEKALWQMCRDILRNPPRN